MRQELFERSSKAHIVAVGRKVESAATKSLAETCIKLGKMVRLSACVGLANFEGGVPRTKQVADRANAALTAAR